MAIEKGVFHPSRLVGAVLFPPSRIRARSSVARPRARPPGWSRERCSVGCVCSPCKSCFGPACRGLAALRAFPSHIHPHPPAQDGADRAALLYLRPCKPSPSPFAAHRRRSFSLLLASRALFGCETAGETPQLVAQALFCWVRL